MFEEGIERIIGTIRMGVFNDSRAKRTFLHEK